jgi:branched-chain amino acid transport system substrate-binding protein
MVSVALALGLVVSGCSSGSSGSDSGPVTIGLEVPLSPPGDAASGQLIQRGAELAVKYVNDNGGVLGGRKIQIAVQDTKGTPDTGVAGYRTLVSSNHAVGVTGFFHSSVNIAVNEVAKDLGVPTLSTQGSAADITGKHYKIAFRTHVVDPIRVAAWMQFIKEKGYQKIALIAEDTDYGTGLVDQTKQQAKDLPGVQVNSVVFDHTATDFTSQLLKIQNWGPDLVINIGVGQPADLILDQASTIGLYPKVPMLISYDAPVRPDFWKLHPKDGAGVYYTGYYSPKQPLSKAGQWLATQYKKKYNEDPVYSSLNGFGDVLILAEAVDQAKSADPKKVSEQLAKGSFSTWTKDPATFPEKDGIFWHNWSPPVLILQYTKANQNWQDAKLVVQYKQGQS